MIHCLYVDILRNRPGGDFTVELVGTEINLNFSEFNYSNKKKLWYLHALNIPTTTSSLHRFFSINGDPESPYQRK